MSDLSQPPNLRLRPRHARPLFARHPWVYAGSFEPADPRNEVGAEVRVESAEGKFIARGLINPASALRVRLYRWDDEALDSAFWTSRIDRALALREALPDQLLASGPSGWSTAKATASPG